MSRVGDQAPEGCSHLGHRGDRQALNGSHIRAGPDALDRSGRTETDPRGTGTFNVLRACEYSFVPPSTTASHWRADL